MDRYDGEPDAYCYPGTAILKNIPGIRDRSILGQYETLAFAERAIEGLPRGRLTLSHYCNVHRHLFQDVYRWAGKFRTVRISKDEAMFCYPEHIAPQMRRIFAQLRQAKFFEGLDKTEFASSAAHFLAELNAIHPFREGNGRCQNAFIGLLAARAGQDLDFARMDPPNFLAAMIQSFQGDEGPLAQQLYLMLLD